MLLRRRLVGRCRRGSAWAARSGEEGCDGGNEGKFDHVHSCRLCWLLSAISRSGRLLGGDYPPGLPLQGKITARVQSTPRSESIAFPAPSRSPECRNQGFVGSIRVDRRVRPDTLTACLRTVFQNHIWIPGSNERGKPSPEAASLPSSRSYWPGRGRRMPRPGGRSYKGSWNGRRILALNCSRRLIQFWPVPRKFPDMDQTPETCSLRVSWIGLTGWMELYL